VAPFTNTMCYNKPGGFAVGKDALNWAVVVPAGSIGMKVRLTSNGVVISTVGVVPGLNYGATAGVKAGAQKLELLDANGKVVLSAVNGRPVSTGCPGGIYNMNYVVLPLIELI
jgi:glucan endo-1,3-alpha-glucosidase